MNGMVVSFQTKVAHVYVWWGPALLSHITYYAQQQHSIEEEEDVQAPIMEVGSGGGGGDYRHRAAVSGPIQEQGE